MESGILSFESTIQLKESGIQQTIGIPSPSSTEKESGIQNPRLFWIILNDATLKTGVLDEGGHINYSLGAKIGSRNTHF